MAALGDEPSIGDLARDLVADAKAYGQAEIALLKARAGEKAGEVRTAAIFFAAAFLILQATIVVLLVGALFMLRDVIGLPWATLVVVLAGLLLVALLAKLGIGAFGSDKP